MAAEGMARVVRAAEEAEEEEREAEEAEQVGVAVAAAEVAADSEVALAGRTPGQAPIRRS